MINYHYTVDGKIEPIDDDLEDSEEITLDEVFAHLLRGGLDTIITSDDEEEIVIDSLFP